MASSKPKHAAMLCWIVYII